MSDRCPNCDRDACENPHASLWTCSCDECDLCDALRDCDAHTHDWRSEALRLREEVQHWRVRAEAAEDEVLGLRDTLTDSRHAKAERETEIAELLQTIERLRAERDAALREIEALRSCLAWEEARK